MTEQREPQQNPNERWTADPAMIAATIGSKAWSSVALEKAKRPRSEHRRAFYTYIEELEESEILVDINQPFLNPSPKKFVGLGIDVIKWCMALVAQPFFKIFFEKQIRMNNVTLKSGYKIAALEKRIFELEELVSQLQKSKEFKS